MKFHYTLATLATALLLASSTFAQSFAQPPAKSSADQAEPQRERVLLYTNFAYTGVDTVPDYEGSVVNGTTSVTSPGIELGGTFNIYRFSALASVTLGIDVRFAYVPITNTESNDANFSNAGRTDFGFLGIKATFHPKNLRLEPYVEIAAGGVTANAANLDPKSPGTSLQTSWTGGEYIGGVDYRLLRHVNIRIVELGIGQGTPTSNEIDDPTGISKTTFYTISSGIVFHI